MEKRIKIIEVEKKSNVAITLGAIIGYISFGIGFLSSFILTPLIIKYLGNSNYGIYTLCNSLINLFLIDFGLSTTINVYISNLRAKNDFALIDKFKRIVFKLYLILDSIIATFFIVLFFFLEGIYKGLTPDELKAFKLIFILISIFNLFSFPSTTFEGFINAYEKFSFNRIVDLLNKVLNFALCLLILFTNFGLVGFVLIHIFSGFITIFLRFIYVKKIIGFKFFTKEKIDMPFIKGILKFSAWAAVAVICSRLVFNVTPSILGIVSNSDQISTFGIITTFEGYIYTFGAVLSGYFAPKISRIYENKKDKVKALESLAIKVGKIEAFLVSLLLLGFYLCGEHFLNFWLGQRSDLFCIYFCTLIISIYQFFYVPGIVFYTSMYNLGFAKQLAFVSIAKALINCGLSFLLSYFFGAYGASIAIFVSRTVELILLNSCYAKYLKVDIMSFFSKVYLVEFILAFIVLTFENGLFKVIFVPNQILAFTIKGLLCVIIYTILNLLIFKKKDAIL